MTWRDRWMPGLNLLLGRPESTAFRLHDIRAPQQEIIHEAVTIARDDFGVQLERIEQRFENLQERTNDLVELMDRRILDLESQLRRVEAASPVRVGIPLTDEQYQKLEGDVDVIGANRVARLEALIGRLPTSTNSLLDIGCGAGQLLSLCPRVGISAVGVDTNRAAVASCVADGLDAVVDDALRFLERQPDGSFDAITLIHVVEHMAGPFLRDLFIEVARVVKPGGVVVVETPNVGSISTLLSYYFADPTHLLPRRVEQYRALFDPASFEVSDEFIVGQLDHPDDADPRLVELGVYGATDLQLWATRL